MYWNEIPENEHDAVRIIWMMKGIKDFELTIKVRVKCVFRWMNTISSGRFLFRKSGRLKIWLYLNSLNKGPLLAIAIFSSISLSCVDHTHTVLSKPPDAMNVPSKLISCMNRKRSYHVDIKLNTNHSKNSLFMLIRSNIIR